MGYVKISADNNAKIAEEARIERGLKVNPLQLKLRKEIQENDYTKMNKYGETMCYGEMKRDQCISTIVNMCTKCMEKRGTEGLLARVKFYNTEELCDFCGEWKFGTMQINCSLCKQCMQKIHALHNRYQQSGGREGNHPYYKYLVKQHGKDWMPIMLDGITKRKF